MATLSINERISIAMFDDWRATPKQNGGFYWIYASVSVAPNAPGTRVDKLGTVKIEAKWPIPPPQCGYHLPRRESNDLEQPSLTMKKMDLPSGKLT